MNKKISINEQMKKPTLKYIQGTITIANFEDHDFDLIRHLLTHDPRTLEYRCEARKYRDVVTVLHQSKVIFDDQARSYDKVNFPLQSPIQPRQHQSEALDAWLSHDKFGVVELPTGAGKTILAMLAIAKTNRPTLIVVPTIDLMYQWQSVVKKYFSCSIGMLGGGSHTVETITIATYDSAAMHAERLGPKFGLIVFDECHHLPGPIYAMIAITSIAPFRLGLSATVERSDGKEDTIYDLIGPKVYEGVIAELEEKTLAPYDIIQIQVEMTPEEWSSWTTARGIYKDFIRRHRVNFSSGRGWQEFLIAVARQKDGPAAMDAYRAQKKLAQSSTAKMKAIWDIVKNHYGERILLFTDDNETAYKIGREFFIPVLTHHTKPKERALILDEFKSGRIKMIATSKVLNEGVDVPEASVGVVVSGSGTVREHVQRLGRILRHQPGKRASLYEIISRGTGEHSTSERRRQHYAYQGSPTIFPS
ncbi:MAG: DEAD/DEAH box helicase family protein [Proteobacteria bacterium]|nr:DEAD/DEAH box helicase family protein [Pseudomonadota bacterium]